MLPVHSLLHELRQSVPYLVGFLMLLVLLVKRDRDAVRLMGYSLQPRYQRLQNSWHGLGYAAVALVGVMLSTSRHGLAWPALLFAGVLSVSWWIGFDMLLNHELGKEPFYVGKTAASTVRPATWPRGSRSSSAARTSSADSAGGRAWRPRACRPSC